jgi:hypothetical protein
VEHDVGVEHREERVEVTLARRGEEGVDDLSLAAEVGLRDGGGPADPPAGEAGKLARCLGGAAHDEGDLVVGHGEQVVQHERQSLGGAEHGEHHQQRGTDRVGQQRFVLGVDPAVAARRPLVSVPFEGLLGRDRRERSMFRHTRATIVVIHPPMLSTTLVSERLSRIQDSWTASSASLSESAEHSVGNGPQVGPVLRTRPM